MTTRSLLVAFAALSLAACVADPTKDQPKAVIETSPITAATATATATAAAAATVATTGSMAAPTGKAETLAIDPVASKIAWTASKPTRTHVGGFKTFRGTITLADAKPEASKVEIEIDTDSIFTDPDMLVKHLKSPEFFDVANHPKASFVSTSITPGAEGGATHTVKGKLTMHGETKDISFPATIAVTDKAVTAKAKFSFNRQDWKIAYKGKADDLVRDDVLMELDVTAPRH